METYESYKKLWNDSKRVLYVDSPDRCLELSFRADYGDIRKMYLHTDKITVMKTCENFFVMVIENCPYLFICLNHMYVIQFVRGVTKNVDHTTNIITALREEGYEIARRDDLFEYDGSYPTTQHYDELSSKMEWSREACATLPTRKLWQTYPTNDADVLERGYILNHPNEYLKYFFEKFDQYRLDPTNNSLRLTVKWIDPKENRDFTLIGNPVKECLERTDTRVINVYESGHYAVSFSYTHEYAFIFVSRNQDTFYKFIKMFDGINSGYKHLLHDYLSLEKKLETIHNLISKSDARSLDFNKIANINEEELDQHYSSPQDVNYIKELLFLEDHLEFIVTLIERKRGWFGLFPIVGWKKK